MANEAKIEAQPHWTLERALPWILLVGGLVALAASFILSVEKFDLLKNPHYSPVCNLNPIFSCSDVATSHQAEVFGFSNDFFGLAGFAAVATIGAGLLAGARFKRWLWQLFQLGTASAIGFVSWLQFQTLYRIGALCIFCMVVWAMTGPIFWYTTLYNLRTGNIRTPRSLQKPVSFAQRHHADILILWFVIIILLIGKRFWYYWSTLI